MRGQHHSRLAKIIPGRRLALLAFVAVALLAGRPCSAYDVMLRWTVPPGPISGYRVYTGLASLVFGTPEDVGLLDSDTIAGVVYHMYQGLPLGLPDFVAVTACNAAGESDYSNEKIVNLGSVTPPVADAGPNQAGFVGDVFSLGAAAQSGVNYFWQQTAGPPASLSSRSTSNPQFAATTAGTLEFTLTAYDPQGVAAQDVVTVVISPAATATPTLIPSRTPIPTATATPAAISPRHDAVVLPVKPIKMTVPTGSKPVVKQLRVKVRNADAGESAPDPIKLMVSSDCPSGVSIGTPDFIPRTQWVNTAPVAAGKVATAVVPIMVHPLDFANQNHKAPSRCTLTFVASTEVEGNIDPTLPNNTMTAELNVVDMNVPEVATNDESLIASLAPMRVNIAATKATVFKNVRPTVLNADILPQPATPGDAIQLSIDLTDCSGITAGGLDMQARLPGVQDSVMVKGGASATGLVRLTVDAGMISTASLLSPARCTAVVSATVGGNPGPDATNNTTKLVIDVVDKHDF